MESGCGGIGAFHKREANFVSLRQSNQRERSHKNLVKALVLIGIQNMVWRQDFTPWIKSLFLCNHCQNSARSIISNLIRLYKGGCMSPYHSFLILLMHLHVTNLLIPKKRKIRRIKKLKIGE